MWMAIPAVLFLVARAGAGEPQALMTQKEKESYTIGVDTAKVLRQQEMEVDLDTLVKGLKDGMTGEKLLMTDPELLATRNAIQSELARKQAAKKQNRNPARKKAGEEKK
jgi:FKBP-type peptidyl-prolyl cis-trans isomerase FklB